MTEYNITREDLQDAYEMGQAQGEMLAFIHQVYAHPDVPASLHDKAARILCLPSLAHSMAEDDD